MRYVTVRQPSGWGLRNTVESKEFSSEKWNRLKVIPKQRFRRKSATERATQRFINYRKPRRLERYAALTARG